MDKGRGLLDFFAVSSRLTAGENFPDGGPATNAPTLVRSETIQPTMKSKFAVILLAILSPVCRAEAQVAATAKAAPAKTQTLFIGPSSTSLSLGKASLIIGALQHREGACCGDYKLEVSPFFFKSEKGKIAMAVSEAALAKLALGNTVEFTGKAVTNGTGVTRAVTAKAVPASGDRGTVTFSFLVDAGKLIFIAPYRFGDK